MVVFVDLDEQEPDDHFDGSGNSYLKPALHDVGDIHTPQRDAAKDTDKPQRENPNVGKFSEALACYPVIRQLATHLDLTTLSSLSECCRQFRANLLPYRSQLIRLSLRCENESVEIGPRLADGLRESRQAWRTHDSALYFGRITSGKVGMCARDLVGDCRRCGKLVCRNCTTKQPFPRAFPDRHRRLCSMCVKAPLSALTTPIPPGMSTSRPSSLSDHPILLDFSPRFQPDSPPLSVSRLSLSVDDETSPNFTSPAFARTPCCCEENAWLCRSCGATMRTDDDTYKRGWAWRAQYSHLGGLGTGIGEGIEGVKCGRGAMCLASKEVEREDDFGNFEPEWQDSQHDGYFVTEVNGIGGVMRKMVKRRVRVGASVAELVDEREGREPYLDGEHRGSVRSWCGWCDRVILARDEEYK